MILYTSTYGQDCNKLHSNLVLTDERAANSKWRTSLSQPALLMG